MKYDNILIKTKMLILFFTYLLFSQIGFAGSLVLLNDEELSNINGQALLTLSNTVDADQGLNFYKLGFEAKVELNANIKNLQLGCGGLNGSGKCDIDIHNLSFGCIAGTSGNCITLPTTVSGQPIGKDPNNAINNQNSMKDFVLTNPFFQFAIKNPESAATRQIVGVRIGADQAQGPLSFGNLNTFSGYFTGKANLTMQGETNVSPVTKADAYFQNASSFLGLDNSLILSLGLYSIYYRDLTIDYSTVARNDLSVSVIGNRVSQASIAGLQLGGVVDQIVNSVSVNQVCARTLLGTCSFVIGPTISNALLPLLKTGIGNYIKGQLASGLGTTSAELNNYVMPYNLANVHQMDVNSNSFGIALSQMAIKYPGYVASAPTGWSMYLQDAFTLNISDKTSNLVNNIAATPNARNGNITLLEPAYRNCYGNLKFC